MSKQEAPFCVQVELTLGCNLHCSFCGLQGVQDTPMHGNRYMSLETAERVAQQIAKSGWTARIEFARRGEPTLNPNRNEIISIFRRWLPRNQLMMTTNGGGLLKGGILENCRDLFNAGLNILAVDDYKTSKLGDKIRAEFAEGGITGVGVREYPRDKEGNPHRRYPMRNKMISFLEDIERAGTGTHAKINNHAGHGAPLDLSYQRPCTKPFREMSINWDGSVDVCCIDWISEYRVGSLTELTLDQIWQHPRFHAARQLLITGDRKALRPCLGCDHPSMRVGLLPDKLGKQTLEPATETTLGIVGSTMSYGPHLKPTQGAVDRIYRLLPEQWKNNWKKWGI